MATGGYDPSDPFDTSPSSGRLVVTQAPHDSRRPRARSPIEHLREFKQMIGKPFEHLKKFGACVDASQRVDQNRLMYFKGLP